MNLPQDFLIRMSERLGERFPAFLRSYDLPAARGLKVNTLKLSKEQFLALCPFELFPVPWAEEGFFHREEKAGGSLLHFAGLFYLQEPSAMCAAPLLEAVPGEKTLDLCAAPGGKSVQLACAMRGKGILISNEIHFERAKILSQNLERMGVSNCAVTCADPAALSRKFPEYFDKILVDAPCSGEGMFKKEPNALREWSAETVALCARRQSEILNEAAKMLSPGGKLVYSTCTFAEEEDEWQIESFLKRRPDFHLVKWEKLYPHEVRGEGHFAALLERKEGEFQPQKSFCVRSDAAAERAFSQFRADALQTFPEGHFTTLPDGRMYVLTENFPDLSGLRILRLGIEAGEWDGKNFKPSHALVMADGVSMKRKISLNETEAENYLRGESFSAEAEDGWCSVTFEGFPLGLGKVVSGVLKNHYPKGLRMRRGSV